MILIDSHTHTRLCRHAIGEPSDYIEMARRRGLRILALTDHCPLASGYFKGVRMLPDELPLYRRWVQDAQAAERERPDGIEVLYGIEMDILPSARASVDDDRILTDEPLDFAIGSVHYQAPEYAEWEQQSGFNDPPSRIRAYFRLLADGAQTGRYDCLGHIDLIEAPAGAFNPNDYLNELSDLFDACVSTGTGIEINTSGLLKPLGRCFPMPEILGWAADRGVRIAVGSDAHSPSGVAYAFDAAEALLRAAGVRTVYGWRRRQPFDLPLDA